MPFKDYFSESAKNYAKSRPDYPPELLAYLANLTPVHDLAWDCATGTGQAAIALAAHFNTVIASDASAQQIQAASLKSNIIYRVLPAEHTDLAADSVDLITVAQALHWFNFEDFYVEVNRVLKPNGVLAAWCYTLPRVCPEVDAIIDNLYLNITRPYWDNRRNLIDEAYQTIPFPFTKIKTPDFVIEKAWCLADFLNYLSTWSGLNTYRTQTKDNPLDRLEAMFLQAWKEPAALKRIQWPIHIVAGRKSRSER